MSEQPSQPSSPSGTIQAAVLQRFGVLPNFFRLSADAPTVIDNLWAFARFAYLDNPLPSLFKERLFVYLSRFCEARYCIARHVGFLVGLGRPAGDGGVAPQTVEQAVRLLRRPLTGGNDLEAQAGLLRASPSPLAELPEPDSPVEQAVFACATHVFLQTPRAAECLDALRHAFAGAAFEHLLVFLAFVRTAHYWTRLHPELRFEDDVTRLLSVHEALAECVLADPEAVTFEPTPALLDELLQLRRERALRQEVERANEASRERERQLRLVTDHAPVLIAHCDAEGRYRFVNRAYARMFGRDPAEVVGRHVREVLGLQGYERARPYLEAVLVGTPTECEVDLPFDGDHEPQTFQAAYEPEFGPDGRVVGFVAAITNITERKRAEQRLAEAHEFLHSSLDALSSHIAVLDEDSVILAVNDAWRRFADENQYTGHNYGIGASYLEACESDSGECVDPGMVAGLRQVLQGRREFFEFEYPCHSPTDRRWFVMRATRFRTPGPVRVVVAHEDVTQRKEAEERLREADRRKDEFLATLAHELRNPLAPIRNGLQILRLAKGNLRATEQAREMMERQLGQMVHLVDDLLDLSRVSRGKIELRRERVDLARVIRQAVETSRPLIDAAGHTLTVEVPPQPIFVDADVTRLAQVVSNLLNNAAKYTERGGRIGLSAEHHGHEVRVAVRDTGVGIPAAMLPHVFDMFTQVDRSLERSQGGLGIGLSIVRRLVEMHGGTVEAHSEGQGRGSEFVVRLPVVLSVLPSTNDAREPARPARRRRVLVADDNRDAATSLATMLDLMGNETRTAHDGREALDVAAAFRPELVLLDIGMPRLNGHDTARLIREQPWGERVLLVALTGWGQEEDRRRSAEAGFDAHLVKPVDPAALEKLVADLRAETA